MQNFIKIDPELSRHRKFLALMDELGISEAAAMGHMVALWSWALNNADQGDITDVRPAVLARAAFYEGDGQQLLDALIQSGFVDVDKKGKRRTLHNYRKHMGEFQARRKNSQEAANHKDVRDAVQERDGFVCQYCGVTTSPHPAAKRNRTYGKLDPKKDFTLENVVLVCKICLNEQGDRSYEEWRGEAFRRQDAKSKIESGPNQNQSIGHLEPKYDQKLPNFGHKLGLDIDVDKEKEKEIVTPPNLPPAEGEVGDVLSALQSLGVVDKPSNRTYIQNCIDQFPEIDPVMCARDYVQWQSDLLDAKKKAHKAPLRGWRNSMEKNLEWGKNKRRPRLLKPAVATVAPPEPAPPSASPVWNAVIAFLEAEDEARAEVAHAQGQLSSYERFIKPVRAVQDGRHLVLIAPDEGVLSRLSGDQEVRIKDALVVTDNDDVTVEYTSEGAAARYAI